MIEKGHHFKLPLENRIWQLCNLNEVEDEMHFIIRCSYYSDFMGKMFIKCDIDDTLSFNLDNLSDRDKFQFLMSVTDFIWLYNSSTLFC